MNSGEEKSGELNHSKVLTVPHYDVNQAAPKHSLADET